MVPVAAPSAAVVSKVICVLLLVSTRCSPFSADGVAPLTSTTACCANDWPLGSVAVAMPPDTVMPMGVTGPKPVIRQASSAAMREPAVPLMVGAPRMSLVNHLTGMLMTQILKVRAARAGGRCRRRAAG